MRKIITATFVTLDGVMQAPGGSEEDTSDDFAYGGWQGGAAPGDEITNSAIDSFMGQPFEMLLGKRTYDIFAGYWPLHEEIVNVAKPFNSTKKYVVSHNSFEPSWNNSELISGDVVEQIRKLKEYDRPDLWVWGSANLIQTLLKNNLIDRMHIWVYPATIGTGKRLFADGTQAEGFKLVESKISTTGVFLATYEPVGPLKPVPMSG